MARNRNQEQERREVRRWTTEEDEILIKAVRSYPQNLARCFMVVAEEIDRSHKAVAAHWYAVTSKKPEVMCFFTASPRHVSKNRKNGMGVESSTGIWRRLCNVLRSIGL